MPGSEAVTRIDASSWRATILPLPKRCSRGTATGFCGGHPAGRAEAARAQSHGCWWPEGRPELLVLKGHKDLAAGRAAGEVIPGNWRGTTGDLGAVIWTRRGDGLAGTDRHDRSFTRTWATGAGGGAVVGVGAPPRQPGILAPNVGLVWREGEPTKVVTGAGEVRLFATDGTRLAGSIAGRATWWLSALAEPIDLAPKGMAASEIETLDGEWLIGTAWKGLCARAGLWRGTAGSFVDLTPAKFQTSRGHGGAGGFQVGYVRVKDTTRSGSAGSDNRAVLWQGAASRWIDLNALLPPTYNASIAWAIEIRGDDVRICGEAGRYEVTDAGTSRESHGLPVAHPVLWTARLEGLRAG